MEQALIPSHSKSCSWHQDWHNCSCGLFDTLAYVEPDSDNQIKTVYLSVEEAMIKQIDLAKRVHNYFYKSQEEALADFMAVNWAWFPTKLGD